MGRHGLIRMVDPNIPCCTADASWSLGLQVVSPRRLTRPE